jgi:hypothetical protein
MPQEKGNVDRCVLLAMHHVAPHKARLMAGAGTLNLASVQGRFGMVHSKLELVQKRLAEIRAAADKGDCAAVLVALDGEFDFPPQ